MFHSSKFTSFIVLIVVLAANVFAACPNGDLDNDCYVGIKDLLVFAGQWLEPAGCIGHPDDCADLLGSDGVDMRDFTEIASNWMTSKPHLSINEFLASNNAVLADGEGGFDDWIEIYNDSDASIDLAGMYLTDDLASPSKWMIPTGIPGLTTIASKGYLLVWADNEAGSGLHAPFKLSAGGNEDVALFDTLANGQGLIDSISFGGQDTDISYGRYTDGGNDIRFFGTPTPLFANSGAYIDEVADTSFNYKRGFYTSPISVTITSNTPGASIYYTLNADDPTTSSTLYTSPLSISSTTCLRAKAFKTGWMATDIDTQTYFYVSDVITQSPTGGAPGSGWPTSNVNGQIINYGMDPDVVNDGRYSGIVDDALLAIPSISLVTDLDNLFDSSIGIYVNALEDTIAWERPVSMELINPDGSPGFQINCGFRIRGGWSRIDSNPKHAFRMFFRSEYGDARLNYPLFGDEGADEFEKVDLRTSQNTSWSYLDGDKCVMNRDVFSRDLQREMGQPYTRSRYYHLYLNGHYWGLFQTQERSEAYFGETYLGGQEGNYDVIKIDGGYGRPYTIEATDGNLTAYNELYDLAMAGFSSNTDYYYVQGLNPDGSRNPSYKKYVEIDSLIDYILINLYGGNTDSINNNWYVLRDRLGEDGFRFFAHDSEWTLLNVNEDQTGIGCMSGFQNFHIRCLHSRLMDNAEYRLRFADRAHKHLANDGILTPTNAENLFMDRIAEIDMAIIAESARWGDSLVGTPRTKDDDWIPTINDIVNNYFPYKTGILLGHMRNRGWYPSIDEPVFNINGSYMHGGYISAGDNLTMTNPNGSGTLYYTLDSTDPRVSSQGSGSTPLPLIAEAAPKKVLVPSGPLSGGTGSISVEYWYGINGTAVSDLTNDGNYPDNPGASGALSSFEIPTDVSENYGTRVRGYLHPPTTGTYKFWIASDDSSELWLSTDVNPANASKIASLSGWAPPRDWYVNSSQESTTISLTAGQTYYIEALHKEGGGGDNLAVAWDGPGFSLEVIDGADLSPYGDGWMQTGFDDFSWTDGTGGVGYENNPGDTVNYTSLIDTTVAMHNVNETCYIRIPFTVDAGDLIAITSLTLDIRYDDGFVAYINGTKVAEALAPASPQWDSGATGLRDDSLCVDATSINISSYISSLGSGSNVLAIHGFNSGITSSDFLITAELNATTGSIVGSVDPTAIEYTGGNITLNESTQVKARVLDGSEWSALNDASYGIGPVAESLRITEIMYNPAGDPNSEFIELKNIGDSAINLKLASFTDGIDLTFDSHILAADDYVVAVRDTAKFNAAHPGFAGTIAGIFTGSIDNSGEPIKLEDAVGTTILDFRYKDGWYNITDGGGFSLTLLDSTNADLTSWSDKDSWTSSTVLGGTPGEVDNGPKPGDIVINELLAHSDTIAYDWVELYNTTANPIDIGGWFLSDNNNADPNLMKYEIAAGQTIGGYGYKVFYENLHFGPTSTDPGRHVPFALSENGETLYLSSGDSGVISGYREKEDFGASLPDVSMGRYTKSAASGYDVDFVAMSSRTDGLPNSSPKVGPIVISEIMYHPSDPDSNAEYVELLNISGSSVTLFDDTTNEPWKFVDDYKDSTPGIEFYFPTNTPVTMTAGERILLVKDLAAFTAKFGAPSVDAYEWTTGSLANAGERLQLSMPGDINAQGVRQYIRVDRVNFSDGSHPDDYPDLPGDPWPTTPDGVGDSLDRINDSSYGNDVANWQAATAGPGS